MKLKMQYGLLFSLVSFLSACSTTSQNTDQSRTPVDNSLAPEQVSVISEVNPSESLNNKALLEQAQTLNAKDQKISELEQSIDENQQQISLLNAQLDNQEAKILSLESASDNSKAAHLLALEKEKNKLAQLDARFVRLQLENESLNQSLVELKAQNRQFKEQLLIHELETVQAETSTSSTQEPPNANNQVADVKQDLSIIGLQQDYDVLNKMHHNLLHKYSRLDEDYQNLDAQYLNQKERLAKLKTNYAKLASSNQVNEQDYAALKQKNFDLAGAISDARSQQQNLWDQIQVKNKVIETLETDNSALREKSVTLDKLTSGQVTSTLPVVDNSLEMGTLNAKILVLESEIAAQKKLLTQYQEKLTELEQSDDKSDLKNIEITRLGQALADLKAKNDELQYEFDQLELAQAVSREQQHTLLQELTMTKESLAGLTQEKQQLSSALAQAQSELISLQGRYEESLLALESAKETRQSLETQLSDLIELEAISAGFKNHLLTSLSGVRWQLPKQVELGASFEIILTATVNDAQAGQVFIAELISDSSLQLVSSVSAEAQAQNGQLQWRWRAKGVSESQLAQVNLFIHQDIQYQEDRILKEVYRDQQTLRLVNDNFFEKYGFWMIAIFAGLMGGFIIGKLNKPSSDNI